MHIVEIRSHNRSGTTNTLLRTISNKSFHNRRIQELGRVSDVFLAVEPSKITLYIYKILYPKREYDLTL